MKRQRQRRAFECLVQVHTNCQTPKRHTPVQLALYLEEAESKQQEGESSSQRVQCDEVVPREETPPRYLGRVDSDRDACVQTDAFLFDFEQSVLPMVQSLCAQAMAQAAEEVGQERMNEREEQKRTVLERRSEQEKERVDMMESGERRRQAQAERQMQERLKREEQERATAEKVARAGAVRRECQRMVEHTLLRLEMCSMLRHPVVRLVERCVQPLKQINERLLQRNLLADECADAIVAMAVDSRQLESAQAVDAHKQWLEHQDTVMIEVQCADSEAQAQAEERVVVAPMTMAPLDRLYSLKQAVRAQLDPQHQQSSIQLSLPDGTPLLDKSTLLATLLPHASHWPPTITLCLSLARRQTTPDLAAEQAQEEAEEEEEHSDQEGSEEAEAEQTDQ